jgi:hypothetical protein
MPHDSKGKPLQAGDVVSMTFKVRYVTTGEKDCNVMLDAIDVADSGQAYLPAVSYNTKLTEKVADAPA